MIPILAGWIVSNSRLIISRIGSAANILRAIITRTRLIAQIHMNVRDMDDLDWSLAAWGRARGGGFGGHGHGVGLHCGPLAEPEDGKTEECGGAGADCHYAKIVGEDWSFESDCPSADVAVFYSLFGVSSSSLFTP